ncbi:MAG TPA: alpha/beta hydrolase [Candidatus Tumulicola sp.]|jgi:pimeloyl-ACP methyl ester carboxylesterase
MKTAKTELLDIAYLDDGGSHETPVLLLHGWPDDAYGMKPVADLLNPLGYRAIVPWLRGFGPTRFRHQTTFRDGRAVALAQDALDFLDALGIERCVVVGHDWGARAGYHMAAIAPERLTALVTLGLKYTPNGAFEVPALEQSRAWWYQWFMTFDGGAEKVRRDPVGFARIQWETWSPAGWFDHADFEKTAKSFLNPDWVPITLHGYGSRWKNEPVDHRYDAQQAKVENTPALSVPFTTIVGEKDGADLVHRVEDEAEYAAHHHSLTVLPNVGHFPARELPAAVSNLTQLFVLETTR